MELRSTILVLTTVIFTSLWGDVKPQTNGECGGTQIGRNGILTSPNYPVNYPVNQVCVWVIIAPGGGKNVRLTFDYFDLEPNSVCRYDYVLLRDGSSGSNVMIGKFCGYSKPATITSSGSSLWVEFRSDSSETRRGFIARWEVEGSFLPSALIPETETIITETPPTKAPTYPRCGGDAHGTRGIITSPGYPNDYPVNKKCTWTIAVPQERKIRLSFDSFNIENDRTCRYDYLEIRDGGDSSGTFISKLCGREVPSAVTSTGNLVYLEFSSDSSETESGFKIEWHAVGGPPRTFPPLPTTPSIPETQEPTTLPGECGDITVRGTGGAITSPNYPSNYPLNKMCSWTIKVESGELVELEFRAFNIERDSTCRYDYVEIRDGNSDQAALKDRLCGDQIPGIMKSTGDALHIVFYSDNSETEKGFHATWRAVDDVGRVSPPPLITTKPPSPEERGCGETLTAITGVFQSPQYPNNYPTNVMCHWTIEAPRGYKIRLELSAFNLEADSTCRFDYLLIYDGSSVGSREIGRFCGPDGSSRIGPVESTSNVMTVIFNSDSSLTNSGFQAYWYSNNGQDLTPTTTTITPFPPHKGACGGNFVQPSGDFYSPGYPYYYSNNLDCVWIIGVPDNKQIALGFEEFDLEGGDNCRLDYVEVRDGGSQNAPLIGRYCGTTAPMLLKGSSNKLWVRFRSNGFITEKGFEATWITEAQFIKPVGEPSTVTLGDDPRQEPLKTCGHSLGVEDSRIKDAQFSASSHWMSIHKYGPQRARLNNHVWPQGWVADPSDNENPWIKIKFDDLHVITSIATQGYGNPLFSEWVKSYKITWFDTKQGRVPYQEEGKEKVFGGNVDRDSIVRHILKVPFTTKEVTLHPKTWQGGIGLRMELYGCTLVKCMKPLGMSNGAIKDNQLRVSSAWINHHGRYGASHARLNITTWPQGWIASDNDQSPWLQIKLGDEYVVTQIATQGFGGALNQWVKAYKLTWLDDKRKWQDYQVKRKNRASEWKIKRFHANKDKNSIVRHVLKSPIRSQFIRIWPLEKHNSFSMRTELYGCPIEQLGRPTLCKRMGNLLIGESRLGSSDGCVWKLSPVSSEGAYLLKFDRFSFKNSDSTCTKDYVEVRNGFTQYAPLIGKFCGDSKPSPVRSSASALWIKYVVSGEVTTKVTMSYEFVPSNSQGNGIHPTSGTCGLRSLPDASGHENVNNWPGQWPWQVALSLMGHSDQQCSGALIGTQWVLTAAHCFQRFQLSSSWVVRVGVWDLHEKDGNEQELSAKAIYRHPHYDSTSHRNDIALIYLVTPVKINERVRTICLPKTEQTLTGKKCAVAGWGRSTLSQSSSVPLLSKNLTILSQRDCNHNVERVGASLFCARVDGDSCFGDAGSPLMCQDESSKWVVTGLSTLSSEGCGLPVKQRVYTNVAANSQWIEQVLDSH